MNCLQLIENFLQTQELGVDNAKLVKDKIATMNATNPDNTDVAYSEDIIAAAIVDSFKLNAEYLKSFSDFCIKKGLQIGRRHKNILLHYLNYRAENDKEHFFHELSKENTNIPRVELELKLTEFLPISTEEAFSKFISLWNTACKNNEKNKLGDYLFGLYSRLHAYYNSEKMSNAELFTYNLPFIKNDLSPEGIEQLRTFCQSSSESFYEQYTTILHQELQANSLKGLLEPVMNQENYDVAFSQHSRIFDRKGDLHYVLTEEFDAVYLRLNQAVYDAFQSYDDFLNYVLDSVQQAYRILVNNKVFAVEIDNIYVNNRNIKWLLYAYIGVYGERFIKTKEHRKFFSPEKICMEMFKVYGYKYDSINEQNLLTLLKKYYHKEQLVSKDIYKLLVTDHTYDEFVTFLNEWFYVYYGFTFNDCYVLETNSDTHVQFASDIRNDNKLLFIFYKYRMDERKIPCPICNGLNVSGNSYPEVGHRSWECKNVICSGRSKSDRGKRYSFKTNYMQFGAQNLDADNVIDKELIAQWRKDITSISTDQDIYYMFIKYFSFSGEKILFINATQEYLEPLRELNRNITNISLLGTDDFYRSSLKLNKIDDSIFSNYFETGNYLNRFTQLKPASELTQDYNIDNVSRNAYIINGDSFEVLTHLPQNSVAAAVTSPPYFNAREYSQWENMYLYFIDMFNIARNTLHVLDHSGVFIYNIGDINGNEMTVVKSNMGNKRMLLGAYSILIFERAGYELVENYIWNKGEPQSKRSTNDGNFTPHYQKPVNCYEHMFIFKRRGEQLAVNSPIPEQWKTFITEFTPVYKINCHGENTLGHTAPYPEDIPNLAAVLFGKKNRFILDPFLGSGTTIISAVKNGYTGIGIEFSKEYANLSKERFSEECPTKTIEML